MNYEEFKSTVVDRIKEYVPDYYADATISIQSVIKNNGVHLDELMIKDSASNICPMGKLRNFRSQQQIEQLSYLCYIKSN